MAIIPPYPSDYASFLQRYSAAQPASAPSLPEEQSTLFAVYSALPFFRGLMPRVENWQRQRHAGLDIERGDSGYTGRDQGGFYASKSGRGDCLVTIETGCLFKRNEKGGR